MAELGASGCFSTLVRTLKRPNSCAGTRRSFLPSLLSTWTALARVGCWPVLQTRRDRLS
jgi:hypothetical protein